MRRIVICTVLFMYLLFAHSSLAQNFRATTFDDRAVCEENHGVWREFGNGCVDQCQAQFNQFKICTMALTYGCDCGVDRCWQDGQCVNKVEYKKTYDVQQSKEHARLEQLKKKRRHQYEQNRRMIVKKLKLISDIEDKVSDAKHRVNEVNSAVKNNQQEEDNKARSGHSPLVDLITQGAKSIQEVQAAQEQQDPKAKQKFDIPEFFLRKQEAQKKQNQQTAEGQGLEGQNVNQSEANTPGTVPQNDTNSSNNVPKANSTLPEPKNEVEPLPLIPLPN